MNIIYEWYQMWQTQAVNLQSHVCKLRTRSWSRSLLIRGAIFPETSVRYFPSLDTVGAGEVAVSDVIAPVYV